MAAALASRIKGQDIVDFDSLRTLADDQLDISPFVFDRVVGVLAELEFVRNLEVSGGRVRSFFEAVPEDHEAMYRRLGQRWAEQEPTEIESSLLGAVERLSHGPAAVDELDIDPTACQTVLDIGASAEAIRLVEIGGREIAYSPFFSIESPGSVEDALRSIDLAEVQRAFVAVREQQGLPVSTSPSGATITRLVGAGLMAGPALKRADGSSESFAVAPYGLAPDLRSIKRPILDKAQAIVAAMRMGEHFGTVTKLRWPAAVLYKLLTGQVTAVHSDTQRQWATLHLMGVVEFVSQGSMKGIRLVQDKHGDNDASVRIAVDLLEYGEAADTKELHPSGTSPLAVQGRYLSSIQGVRVARQRAEMPDDALSRLVDMVMGRSLP